MCHQPIKGVIFTLTFNDKAYANLCLGCLKKLLDEHPEKFEKPEALEQFIKQPA
jgi:hypothetical protein